MSRRREFFYICGIAMLATALVVALLLGAWGLKVWGRDVDYSRLGTWSDAISGLATFLAFVAAVVAISIERGHRLEEASQKQTAVYFWFSPAIAQPEEGVQVYVWDIVIENTTSAPILCWKLVVEGHEDIDLCNHTKRPLLPTEGWNTFNLKELDGTQPSSMPQGSLTFVDRSNRVWIRTIAGDLTEQARTKKVCDHNHDRPVDREAAR